MNLLTERLVSTQSDKLSLPGVFAAMARGEVTSFPAMRPHQRPAWHMFLVQLATLALRQAGLRDLPTQADAWATTLRGLTLDHGDDPWCLIGSDPARPAFLQPPDPGGLKWTTVTTPDALDMLITSRNHDLKQSVARLASPEDWMFALASLQTMEGYGGAGNKGIARMNGGSSSRSMLGLAPNIDGQTHPSFWWMRDTQRLLELHPKVPNRHSLLWLRPWPEGRALDLGDLDPLFIEVCRRVRLSDSPSGGLRAMRSTSKNARVDAKAAKGMTGDPWAPVHRTEGKAFTLGDRDWTYGLLVELLLKGNWEVPCLARPAPQEEAATMLLVAEAFARGNSKTDGFRSRTIPVPKLVMKHFLGSEVLPVADEQMKDISDVDRVLRNALALKAARGEWQAIDKHAYVHARPSQNSLSRFADKSFFPILWDKLQAGDRTAIGEVRLRFVRVLSGEARRIFEAAHRTIPCPAVFRPKAEARARRALERGLATVEARITGDVKEPIHGEA